MLSDSELDSLFELSSGIGDSLVAKGQTITAVESCTAGGVAFALTMVPGSSEWFHCSFVTYTNQAKTDLVGIPEELFIAHGAVSLEVAAAMSQGAQKAALADYSIAITGIAGPGGGSSDKPVGTVCFGWAAPDSAVSVERMLFAGDRKSIRIQSIHHALVRMLAIVKQDR
ncbi:MAG: CinA family protein [Gammaproteobacteria bacterium]|nr:CinA family protein [Gammaproteobacteria bacterium]MCY4226193.1 CinA family protein [Gammaproteobacteria bacterium]